MEIFQTIFGISYINLKSLNECCCKLCPQPNQNELIFLEAGQDYLEDKTFHYLSNSLFDLSDDDQQTASSSDVIINPDIDSNKIETTLMSLDLNDSKPKSRNKFGVVDENYGQTRFGAIFMDYFIQKEQFSSSHKSLIKINASKNIYTSWL